ncbi:hypothetical protein BX265_5016 [Streptomyces sp. TLI_235]|nr:hypothetical protein [Streptomyces sp. TLI_235]PBC80178.1 hypothetical protein BX265_5016 [Streptomyces sp. TLI_235]
MLREGCGLTAREATLHDAGHQTFRICGVVRVLPIVLCTEHHLESKGLEVIASSAAGQGTAGRDSRRLASPVPDPVDPKAILSQGVVQYFGSSGQHEGWCVLERDGRAYTDPESGWVFVWDSFSEAYDNRRIIR